MSLLCGAGISLCVSSKVVMWYRGNASSLWNHRGCVTPNSLPLNLVWLMGRLKCFITNYCWSKSAWGMHFSPVIRSWLLALSRCLLCEFCGFSKIWIVPVKQCRSTSVVFKMCCIKEIDSTWLHSKKKQISRGSEVLITGLHKNGDLHSCCSCKTCAIHVTRKYYT